MSATLGNAGNAGNAGNVDVGTLTLAEAKLALFNDATEQPREGLPTWGHETEEQKLAKARRIRELRLAGADKTLVLKVGARYAVGAAVVWRLVARLLERAGFAQRANALAAAVVAVIATLKFGTGVRSADQQRFRVKSVSELPFVGSVLEMLTARHRIHNFVLERMREHNFQPCDVRIPGGNFAFLIDLRDREYVLRTKPSHFLKNLDGDLNSVMYGFGEVMGAGIFAVDGEAWRDQRKIASKMFAGAALQNQVAKVFNAHGDRLVEVLDMVAAKNEPVDIQACFQALIFDGFCEVAFGVCPGALDVWVNGNGKRMPFLVAFDSAQCISSERFGQPPALWHLARLFRVGNEAQLKKDMAVLRDYITPIVADRRNDKTVGARHDLLSLYVDYALQTNQPHMLEDNYLTDLVLNFMIAGRDTTSCLLTQILAHMTPEASERLAKELEPHKGYLGFDEQVNMAFPNAVVNEALRMGPSVPDDFHISLYDDVLPSGMRVTRGTRVAVSNAAIGRDPSLWSDPNTFKPERWMRKDEAGNDLPVRRPDEFVFPVFFSGQRLCLGKDMARYEACVMLAKIMSRFRVRLTPGAGQGDYVTGPVAFFQDGLKVVVERR